MLQETLTTTCLGRIGVVEREEKGRASEGAAGGAAEGENRAGEKAPSRISPGDGHRVQTRLGERGPGGPKPGENWKPVGAVAAEVVARCQTGKRRRERHAPAPLPTGTPR